MQVLVTLGKVPFASVKEILGEADSKGVYDTERKTNLDKWLREFAPELSEDSSCTKITPSGEPDYVDVSVLTDKQYLLAYFRKQRIKPIITRGNYVTNFNKGE